MCFEHIYKEAHINTHQISYYGVMILSQTKQQQKTHIRKGTNLVNLQEVTGHSSDRSYEVCHAKPPTTPKLVLTIHVKFLSLQLVPTTFTVVHTIQREKTNKKIH